MSPYARPIVSSASIPGSDRRWLYRLTCGHSANRRQNGAKRVVQCGQCEALGHKQYV